MIELLGWGSTALVLLGYIMNARGNSKLAMITWIVGNGAVRTFGKEISLYIQKDSFVYICILTYTYVNLFIHIYMWCIILGPM